MPNGPKVPLARFTARFALVLAAILVAESLVAVIVGLVNGGRFASLLGQLLLWTGFSAIGFSVLLALSAGLAGKSAYVVLSLGRGAPTSALWRMPEWPPTRGFEDIYALLLVFGAGVILSVLGFLVFS